MTLFDRQQFTRPYLCSARTVPASRKAYLDFWKFPIWLLVSVSVVILGPTISHTIVGAFLVSTEILLELCRLCLCFFHAFVA